MMQGEIKNKNPEKESIIVLFTAAPGHPIPAYKNIINFFITFSRGKTVEQSNL